MIDVRDEGRLKVAKSNRKEGAQGLVGEWGKEHVRGVFQVVLKRDIFFCFCFSI